MSHTRLGPLASLTSALVLAWTGGAQAQPSPPSVEPLDVDVVYTGVWYEQARTPTSLTKGCEHATTSYSRSDKGEILVRDACLQGGETGPERAIAGVGRIQDPAVNSTLKVSYRFGPFRPTREYRIIATDAGRSWFVSAEPGLKRVYVFSRAKAPPRDAVEGWIARARALGYDGPIEVLATFR